MIETPLGVLRVAEICSEMQLRERQGRFRRGTARPSLTTLCMGFADLGKDLHVPHVPGRSNLVTSAQLCVLAARAYGLLILDGVHLREPHTDKHLRSNSKSCQLVICLMPYSCTTQIWTIWKTSRRSVYKVYSLGWMARR